MTSPIAKDHPSNNVTNSVGTTADNSSMLVASTATTSLSQHPSSYSPPCRTSNPLANGSNKRPSVSKQSNTSSSSAQPCKLPSLIIFSKRDSSDSLTPPDDNFRAVHRIRLSALQHNFQIVEGAANRQRCSVIGVVKADGYGHGAIASALYLADVCGCDAFAVATLEEGIALRKAFENNPPGKWSKELASLFHTQIVFSANSNMTASTGTVSGNSRSTSPVTCERTARIMRPPRIRVVVLGPPVGFPRCFDDYLHHEIEISVSGPEVAKALVEWVVNETERKRTQVERAAFEAKAKALTMTHLPRDAVAATLVAAVAGISGSKNNSDSEEFSSHRTRLPCSTLGNVSGQDLAREVKALLISQSKAANEGAMPSYTQTPRSSAVSTANSSDCSESSDVKLKLQQSLVSSTSSRPPVVPKPQQAVAFGGIEAAARTSRHREIASARANSVISEDDEIDQHEVPAVLAAAHLLANAKALNGPRKKLRWHASVDSGMGRLGFRTEPVQAGETRQETVEVLKELVEMEIHGNAPIEFYGMCTHMAEANATSTYTSQQIKKFVCLLKRVREAGIFVPTLSTDNSMALMTTELNHFDPKEILSQSHADTRGYVRIGGAIYGQRPAFKQLKAVSTLLASVRHVAILRKGESVGYDRAYVAEYDVRIATLTIGFADGYPRELGNRKGQVAIRGCVFNVVGNVCMDMVMVELGPAEDLTGVGATVSVRDIAVMWGPLDDEDGEGLIRLQDVAAKLNTTQSALTCGLDKIRVRRQFI